ncbi:MAG: hypothetical protein H0T84_10205 [Tatlockia sp.]|nr:hypothetical protein [Tatlockia sp.]
MFEKVSQDTLLLDDKFSQFPTLQKHLKQMREIPARNDRLSQINKTDISDLSKIVLETREAIIQHVKSSIPVDYKGPIVTILGSTGSGKSTTLCFLRGDKMVQENFGYTSKNDTEGYIGKDIAQSQTLLPNIEILDKLAIIDFAGFKDTNGFLVDLGVELALKALLKEYNPKILFLESITNTGGRFQNVADDGRRLSHFFENKEEVCVLGLTKYLLDSNEYSIKKIEEKQRDAQLYPSQRELELTGAIDLILNIVLGDQKSLDQLETLQQELHQKQKELKELQQKREESINQPLTDTPEKQQYREQIKQTEDEFLKQIGLKQVIRFKDLENSNQLEPILEQLSSPTPPICLNHRQKFKSDSETHLNNFVRINFLAKKNYATESQRRFAHFNDFESFKSVVLEHSLIYAIDRPGISDLLELSEINPDIVEALDHDLITACFDNFIKGIVGLNIGQLNLFLSRRNNHSNANCNELQKKLTDLENFVKGIVGLSEEAWVKNQRVGTVRSFEESHRAPSWISSHSYFQAASPISLFSLKDSLYKEAQISEELLSQCNQEITDLRETLLCLVKTKALIINKKSSLLADKPAMQMPGLNDLKTLFSLPSEPNIFNQIVDSPTKFVVLNTELNKSLNLAILRDETLLKALEGSGKKRLSSELVNDLLTLQKFYQQKTVEENDENYGVEYNLSIHRFYESALQIRLSNKPIKQQAKEISDKAHAEFQPRHGTERLLADALMLFSILFAGLGLVIMLGRYCAGRTVFFSSEVTGREHDLTTNWMKNIEMDEGVGDINLFNQPAQFNN